MLSWVRPVPAEKKALESDCSNMSLISDERLTLEKSPLETSGFPATTTVTDRFSVENEQMTKNTDDQSYCHAIYID